MPQFAPLLKPQLCWLVILSPDISYYLGIGYERLFAGLQIEHFEITESKVQIIC